MENQFRTPELNFDNSTEVMQKANAFANMAAEISNIGTEEYQQVHANQMAAGASKNAPMIGPSYLNALKKIEGLSDSKATEVELPLLNTKAEVTPLTGKEEQSLRTASVTIDGFLLKLNELLYSHVTFRDFTFNSFQDFLENLFPPDKSLLVWALLNSSYLTLPTLEKQCESCKQTYRIEAAPMEMVHGDTLKQRWEHIETPGVFTVRQTVVVDGIEIELQVPSEKVRVILADFLGNKGVKNNVQNTGNVFSYSDTLVYFIKSIVVGSGADAVVLRDAIADIYPFLKNVPPKVMDLIRSKIDITVFDDYMPEFYLDTSCTFCGHNEKVLVDPETTFFRKTLSI
jgi:hypothetical protein